MNDDQPEWHPIAITAVIGCSLLGWLTVYGIGWAIIRCVLWVIA